MTIKSMWDDFRDRVYPDGMLPDHEREVRNAFYAGIAISMRRISQAAVKFGEDATMDLLDELCEEIKEWNEEGP
jgi:hypothetical protein